MWPVLRAGDPCRAGPRPSGLPIDVTLPPGASGPWGLGMGDVIMAETAVRRTRHSARRTNDADRKNAAAALQRALDRRDNGGTTGH